MDLKLVRVVKEDLDYLTKEWNQDIDDASLRRASTVLRSLLIEGKLLNVARYFDIELKIIVPSSCKDEPFTNIDKIQFYQCGGARYHGMEIRDITYSDKALSQEAVQKLANVKPGDTMPDEQFRRLFNLDTRQEPPPEQSYPEKLSEFLKQVSFIIEGQRINREEVIKYVANKLGGAHYDSRRDVNKELEAKYILMDKAQEGRIIVAEKNVIYYELLSIGQRIVNSDDIRTLRRMCGSV